MPFDELDIGNVRERIIEDVADVINRTHPWGAPWKLLLKEVYQGEVVSRDYLQVYRTRGRQPMHLDSGTPWFEVNGKKMCILSSVLHLTDGVATKIAPRPSNAIHCVREAMFAAHAQIVLDGGSLDEEKMTPEHMTAFQQIADEINACAKKWDAEADESIPDKRNRVGQLLLFNPCEYWHCGMGHDARTDSVDPEFFGRVIHFGQWAPSVLFDKLKYSPLLSSEEPWGLIEPVSAHKV